MAETRTSFAIPSGGCHPECDEIAKLLIADHVPLPFPSDMAVRGLGIRDKVHPRDVHATLHATRDLAEKFMAANRAHYGHEGWTGTYNGGGHKGAGILVVDLREALSHHGAPITDPDLPDDWTPTGKERRR